MLHDELNGQITTQGLIHTRVKLHLLFLIQYGTVLGAALDNKYQNKSIIYLSHVVVPAYNLIL